MATPQITKPTPKFLAAVQAGDWRRALQIASHWRNLGPYQAAITTAASALVSPRFYQSLGQDPETIITHGIAALKAAYGHNNQETSMSKKQQTAATAPVATTAQTQAAPSGPRPMKLRPNVLAALGPDTPAQAALEKALCKAQTQILACDTQAKAMALYAVYQAMPQGNDFEKAWRNQHRDALNAHIRAMGTPARELKASLLPPAGTVSQIVTEKATKARKPKAEKTAAQTVTTTNGAASAPVTIVAAEPRAKGEALPKKSKKAKAPAVALPGADRLAELLARQTLTVAEHVEVEQILKAQATAKKVAAGSQPADPVNGGVMDRPATPLQQLQAADGPAKAADGTVVGNAPKAKKAKSKAAVAQPAKQAAGG